MRDVLLPVAARLHLGGRGLGFGVRGLGGNLKEFARIHLGIGSSLLGAMIQAA